MKVVRIIARLNIGGPSHQVVLLSNALQNAEWETRLVVGTLSPGEGDGSFLLEEWPCHVVKIPELQRSLHPIKDLIALGALLRVLLKEKPAIVHTHTAKAGTIGRLAGLWYRWLTRRPLKMVHTFHGHVLQGYFHPWKSRFFIAVEKWLARRTDCLISVSHAGKQELISYGIGSESTLRVIPLGLHLDPFFCLNGKKSNRPLRVGFVGRLVPIKNPELMLEGISQLHQNGKLSGVEFLIAGDGELKVNLIEKAQDLGIASFVTFMGWQHDVRHLYELLDIVCLTSRNEGTPVSLIESLAAGKAVIATDVGGVRELLDPHSAADGWNQNFQICPHGILFRSESEEGFVGGLDFLIQHPDFRIRIGQEGRAFVREKYGKERLIRDIKSLYEELVPS